MAREPSGAAGVTLSESDGVRYLHFGTPWVQGAMALDDPYRLELEYQQQMMAPLLFVPRPDQVLQLGLGAAALTKFCHRHLRSAQVRVVERSAAVIEVARRWFALPADGPRLQVVHADARAYLRAAPAADWLQVDLYDAQARGPVLDDLPFYRACRRVLQPGGVAAFNLFGSSLRPSLARIEQAFGTAWLRLPRSAAGNHVVLAFAAAAVPGDAATLRERARTFEQRLGLPLAQFLEGARGAKGRLLLTELQARMPSGSSRRE